MKNGRTSLNGLERYKGLVFGCVSNAGNIGSKMRIFKGDKMLELFSKPLVFFTSSDLVYIERLFWVALTGYLLFVLFVNRKGV